MNLELLVELVWKSVATAGLTLLALHLAKRRSAGERSWIAHLGLVATLLLPLSVAAGPNWGVKAIPSFSSPLAVKSASAAAPAPDVGSAPTPPAVARPAAVNNPVGAEAIVPWLYGIPAGLLALLLLVAMIRLHALRRRAEVLVEPRWLTALATAQRRMGFKHATALLVSEDLQSPISWGVMRPIILLDARAATDTAQAEAIIAHELAHVARLDWAMLILGRLTTAIFWFNPLVWLLARRCHELSEQAVDDAVLRSDIRSTDYVQVLLGAARHNNRAVLLAANGVAGSGPLTNRVERVLDSTQSRAPARWPWIVACGAAAVFTAGPLSALSPRAAEPMVDRSYAARIAPSKTGGEAPHQPPAILRTQPEPSVIADAGEAVDVFNPAAPLPGAPVTGATPTATLTPLATPRQRADGAQAPSSLTLQRLAEAGQPDASRDRQNVDQAPALAASEVLNSTPQISAARAQPKPEGKSPGIRDPRPLIVAAWHGRVKMIEFLLAEGANVDGAMAGEGTPLTKAAARGNMEVVKLLLDRGANINKGTSGEGTALGQASYHGHEAIVRHLLARGADVNRSYNGETPLSLAVAGDHPNIVRLLVAAGAGRQN